MNKKNQQEAFVWPEFNSDSATNQGLYQTIQRR